MATLATPAGELGWRAEEFVLKDAYGNPFRLYDHKGSSGTLVMFICNHCPYVRDRRPHCAGRPRLAGARDRRGRGHAQRLRALS